LVQLADCRRVPTDVEGGLGVGGGRGTGDAWSMSWGPSRQILHMIGCKECERLRWGGVGAGVDGSCGKSSSESLSASESIETDELSSSELVSRKRHAASRPSLAPRTGSDRWPLVSMNPWTLG